MAIKTFTAGEVLTAANTNTYLANSGLVYVSTQTLSGTTFNSSAVFSDTYDNYRLVFSNITSQTGAFYMKMRAAGSTTAGGYYSGLTGCTWSGSVSGQSRNNSSDGWYLSYLNGANYPCGGVLDLFNPYKASTRTHFSFTGNFWDQAVSGGGYHLDTTQFDAFTLICAFSLSGTVTVYGYRKA